ncbi:MAG TPA: hypothetical protein VNT27_01040 [Propionibacteriaceae bacterium]|nr:hypothetical protein [Propionibacteriaceae bacterium]
MRAAKGRRPRGHIRELPSGSLQVIVYAETDPLTKKPSVYPRDPQDVRRGGGRADEAAGPG